MHVLMLKEVIACCRQRQAEGDCPTRPAFSVEQLEDAVVQLADRLHEAEGRLLAAAGPKLDPIDRGTPAAEARCECDAGPGDTHRLGCPQKFKARYR